MSITARAHVRTSEPYFVGDFSHLTLVFNVKTVFRDLEICVRLCCILELLITSSSAPPSTLLSGPCQHVDPGHTVGM